MSQITLHGKPIETCGTIISSGSPLLDFVLTASDLSDKKLADFEGKKLVLNIFPSIDTGVCAASTRRFNQEAAALDNTIILSISKDLPFAQSRFCAAEGLENVVMLSMMRNDSFGQDYGLTITSGPLTGLLSRAVIVANSSGAVIYSEQVPEIAQEPDYDAALEVVKNC